MLNIAVTGATGFIGRALLRQLLSAGHNVRALARNPAALAEFDSPQLTVIKGDLANQAALESLINNATHVVHLAGQVKGRSKHVFDKVNVDGTRALLNALGTRAIPLIVTSSLAAREPGLSWYASSKAHAEDLIRETVNRRPTCIIRPPAVYGPGDTEMLPVFRFMCMTGIAPVPGSAESRLSLIFVDDLVAALVRFINRESSITGIYTLHDGRVGGYNWFDLCEIVGSVCGKRIRPRKVPAALLNTAAQLNLGSAWLTRRAPMLTPSKLRELRHRDWVCNNDGISEAIQWAPKIRLAEGLLRTSGWRD